MPPLILKRSHPKMKLLSPCHSGYNKFLKNVLGSIRPSLTIGCTEEISGATEGYTELTLAELANGMVRTQTAIRWCWQILDGMQEPKTMGRQRSKRYAICCLSSRKI